MKNIYFLLLTFSFFTTANSQIVIFSDSDFKARLLEANTSNTIAKNLDGNFFKIDANNDGEIQESEALSVTYLNISSNYYSYYEKIEYLTGIKSFTNLKTLNCSYNRFNSLNLTSLVNLSNLDCSNNELEWINISLLVNLSSIDCSRNLLTSLNVSSFDKLSYLNCSYNKLTSLNVSSFANLTVLICNNNSISYLDVSTLINMTSLNCTINTLKYLNVSLLVNLTSLDCAGNDLTSLDVSNLVNLTSLDCGGNELTSINVSRLVNLKHLYCYINRLTSLNVSTLANLTFLACGNNPLTSIDVSKLVNLTSLQCNGNQLASLNVSTLLNLTDLYCGSNQLTSLNVSTLVNLTTLECGANQLTSIDVSKLVNLTSLRCHENQLTSIDLSELVNLTSLDLDQNQLTNLDVSKLVKLTSLNCNNNQLISIDLTNLTLLKRLYCYYNLLTTLDVSKLVYLDQFGWDTNRLESLFINNGKIETNFYIYENPNLKYICVDENELVDIQKYVTDNGYINCQVNSYCSFTPGGTYYTIQGNQKLDINTNGCDDNDILLPNLKFTITNGIKTGSFISNTTGNYSITVEDGTHTITPVIENPTYFTVFPTTVNIIFPIQTNPFTQDFCITPNGVHPDLEITLMPLQPARPGFDAKYKLVYKNKGNTIQSGSINLTFTDAVLDLVVANPIVSNQTANNLSWDFTNLQPFETREITFTMNVNSPMETPAVNNGDILVLTATITSALVDETPTDNTFTFNQTVVGSYDPNDKTCLEGSVITPNLIGQYVHYTIRFENTGTFAAENVVVKDMIDLTKFDIATLVPTSASHSYFTRISEGNKVEFIFENINLPFDDANNDGYIAFKIKTKPTLVVNDSFSNEASIFFDYNFPIVTNKATSTFKTLGTQDFDFDRYFSVYPNPAKSVLNITTKESINTQSMQVYNTLGQLVLVITNAEKTSNIDVSSLKSGNYFIQIKTDKGSSSSRFVKE